jgi:hypothetical protein
VVTIHKANTPGVDVCFGVDSVCVREAPSGRVAVLVDQSAEEVNPFDQPNRLHLGGRRFALGGGHGEVDASMRPGGVVVHHVGSQRFSRWRRLQISTQSRHSCRTGRSQRFANALAFGARGGIFTTSIPAAANTVSKAR